MFVILYCVIYIFHTSTCLFCVNAGSALMKQCIFYKRLYYYHWVDAFAGELLVPEVIVRTVFRHWRGLLDIFSCTFFFHLLLQSSLWIYYYYVMFVQFFMSVLYVMIFYYCRRFVRRRIYISSACFRILVVYYILYCINMSCCWIKYV